MRSTALARNVRRATDAAPLSRSFNASPELTGPDRVEVAGVDYLSIFTPELRRSVTFYARVFGFRVIEASQSGAGRSVLMAVGRFHLAIRERQASGVEQTPALCCSFVVDDLDRARASVWNLGVVPIREGAQEPRHIRSWRRSRSFVIRDPGGNEIEVVERER